MSVFAKLPCVIVKPHPTGIRQHWKSKEPLDSTVNSGFSVLVTAAAAWKRKTSIPGLNKGPIHLKDEIPFQAELFRPEVKNLA